jgi:hypothetical protein
MKARQKKILPVFNRCVLFNTSTFAYHGHPEPLLCPEGNSRKSLALYYYTATAPPDYLGVPHDTLWQNRPGEKLRAAKSSTWTVRSILGLFAPPIYYEASEAIRRMLRAWRARKKIRTLQH